MKLIVLLLFCLNLYSQNNEISFKRYSVAESKGYKIKIREINEKLYIEAFLMDSISKNAELDKEYKKLNKKLVKALRREKVNYELAKPILIKIEDLYDRHTFQKTDFVLLKKEENIKFYNEFHKIINTPTHVLRKENRSRIVLNGHVVSFIVKTDSYQDFFILNSPNENSNPDVMKFIKATFEIFRTENKNNFLDREYTFGL